MSDSLHPSATTAPQLTTAGLVVPAPVTDSGISWQTLRLLLLFSLVLLGAVLRFYHLDKQDLWRDEELTVLIAEQSWWGIVQCLHLDGNTPLFYFFVHLWLPFSSRDIFLLRLLPALFGLATIPMVYLLGRAWANEKVGLWAAALLAVAPPHIYYSQELRMYTLLPLLSVVLAWFFQRVLRGERMAWAGYFATATLLIYTHYWGILVLLTINLLYWQAPPASRPPWKPWLLLQAGVLATWIPWLPVLQDQMHYTHGYLSKPNPFAVLVTLYDFALGQWPNMRWKHEILFYTLYELAAITLVAIALLSGTLNVRRSAKQWHLVLPRTLNHVAVVELLFLPLIIAFLLSLHHPIYFQDRYPIMVLPFFCILLARGMVKLNPRSCRIIAMVLLLSWGLHLRAYFNHFIKSIDRQMVQIIEEEAHPGDVVLTTDWIGIAYTYYGNRRLIHIGFPRPGFQGIIYEVNPSYNLPRVTSDTLKQIREALAKSKGRLWVLRGYNNILPAPDKTLYFELRRTFTTIEQYVFMEGEVLLLRTRDSLPARPR